MTTEHRGLAAGGIERRDIFDDEHSLFRESVQTLVPRRHARVRSWSRQAASTCS